MDRKKKFIKYIFLVSSLFAVFLIIIYALFLLEDSIAVLSEKVAFFLFRMGRIFCVIYYLSAFDRQI